MVVVQTVLRAVLLLLCVRLILLFEDDGTVVVLRIVEKLVMVISVVVVRSLVAELVSSGQPVSIEVKFVNPGLITVTMDAAEAE